MLYDPGIDKFIAIDGASLGNYKLLNGERVGQIFTTVVAYDWRIDIEPEIFMENFMVTRIENRVTRSKIASMMKILPADWDKLTLQSIDNLPASKCLIPLKWGPDAYTQLFGVSVGDTLITLVIGPQNEIKRASIIWGDLEQDLKSVTYDPEATQQEWQLATIQEVERAIRMFERYT